MLGIILFTSIAFVISIILVVINYLLNKNENKIDKVTTLLPGYNCQSCGFSGCYDMAVNIVSKGADPHWCKFMNEEQLKSIKDYLSEDK